MDTVVLAYSGGLDTSVAIKWIKEKYNLDVIALTIDLGSERNLPEIKQRALNVGAIDAKIVDGREMFLKYFAFPALQAGAIYEREYPLATAIGRPLIAKLLVDVAHETGAKAVAHGCTGKGNDQVRLDVSVTALDPNLKIIAPVREWKMSRPAEIEYAREKRHPDSRQRQQSVFHRCQFVGPQHRSWHFGRPMERAARRCVAVDEKPRRRAQQAAIY